MALSIDQLKKDIESGKIDTVVVGATDMQGRLQGKRIHGKFFLDDTIKNGTEGCNYLLASDIEMNTIQGYISSNLITWIPAIIALGVGLLFIGALMGRKTQQA